MRDCSFLRIPGLALLSLSLTDCVDRNSGSDGDGIIGDWHAVKIDGELFPMNQAEGPYVIEYGVELHVEADLRGSLVSAVYANYDGYVSGYDRGSTIVVDASDAPKYRIDVTRDLFGGGYDESYGPEPTGGPYDSVGYSSSVGYDTDTTGYDTDPTGGGTGGTASTGGALEEPGSSRPLRVPRMPRLAPAETVLRCTLDADVLSCKRDGDELPSVLVFERTEDGGQSG